MISIVNMRKIILLIGFVSCFIFRSSAGVSISQFQIPSQYLTMGDYFIPITGSATPFTVNVALIKAGIEYNTVKVTVIHQAPGGAETELSTPIYHYDGNWASNNIWQSQISAIFPANHTLAGKIYLKIQLFEGSNVGATTYSIIGYSINGGTPAPGSSTPINWDNPSNSKFILVNAAGRNTFNAGTTILRNGVYHLEFQSDGNLVLYNGGTPIWASGKKRGNNSTQVRFYDSGIGCYEGNTNYFWVSFDTGYSYGSRYSRATWVLQDDGNFVCYADYSTDSNGVIIPVYSYTVGATMTQGGQKSNRSGRIN